MLCIAGKKKRTMQAFVTCAPCVIFALTEKLTIVHYSVVSIIEIFGCSTSIQQLLGQSLTTQISLPA